MLPIKLTALDPESERARYAVVRLDTMAQMAGMILAASVETGACTLRRVINGETKAEEHQFGPGGLRIVVKQ